jgi:hypothetical protein
MKDVLSCCGAAVRDEYRTVDGGRWTVVKKRRRKAAVGMWQENEKETVKDE